ncbi:aldo/keto reductase [Chlorogloeopsis sp. ULAP01]|uniref:aldo/keto reductase n=1 Tax=Chlorogloeopsis TaxID=1123 RepID=UPI0019F2DCE5|nr:MULTISPECIES: aldo/keto reductase [Chlorogloeopsis]MBF2005811.1 aldo/keto reductase [Chlorogloeopsis fritschii C42_A2020_084]MDM9384554.1 aldo/keto reductase [Chlorogloeopsis sp. ULAP01]
MKYCTLGNSDLSVSAIGFGAMVLSPGIYQSVNDEESRQTLQQILDLGINFIDTADIYGNGHNEQLIGSVIRKQRDRVVLATKFGGDVTETGHIQTGNGRPEYVHQAIDASLQRLGVDYVDVYYLHRVDPATPIEETVGAMAKLVQAGKVRYLGLSEVSVETIRRAHQIHPITVVESEYSLFTRDPELAVLPALQELGIGFVAYSPLGRGFLSGQIKRGQTFAPDDWRRTQPRFQGKNLERNLDLAETVEQIASEKGTTAAQLALAWLLHQGDNIVPIPGSRRFENMRQNAEAANVLLTERDLSRLNAVLPAGAVSGDRADQAYIMNTNR